MSSNVSKAVRVTFISGHIFGLRALEGIVCSPAFKMGRLSIDCVLGLHPRNSVNTVGYADLVNYASLNDLHCQYFNNAKSSNLFTHLSSYPHDFLLAVGLSQILSSEVLQLPATFNKSGERNTQSHGCIGMHPTLLPNGRGRAPIPWTILNQLSISGVTAFFLEESADEGRIIDQQSFIVETTETASTLFEKAAVAHYHLGFRLASLIANRSVASRPQDEKTASLWQRRKPSDGWIDFHQSANSIDRLVRALAYPYPRAFFVYRNVPVLVENVEVFNSTIKSEHGHIVEIASDNNPIIACNEGHIKITKWSTPCHVSFELGNCNINSKVECIDD